MPETHIQKIGSSPPIVIAIANPTDIPQAYCGQQLQKKGLE